MSSSHVPSILLPPPPSLYYVWSKCYWVRVLRPTRYKIGHFRDVLPSQSLNLTQQKRTAQEQNGKHHTKSKPKPILAVNCKNCSCVHVTVLSCSTHNTSQVELRFCIPLNTKQVISETFFPVNIKKETKSKTTKAKNITTTTVLRPFFSGTTRVSRCQKRTSGLYGARED